MSTREQIQQDLQTLPQEALDLVSQFIQLLNRGCSTGSMQHPAEQPEKGSSAAILNFLHTHPLIPEHQRSPAEIDQQVHEERAAWD
jgi:hypothetical protein